MVWLLAKFGGPGRDTEGYHCLKYPVQAQGEAAYKKDANDATSANRRVALEEEYTAFKNTKEFKPLLPRTDTQLIGSSQLNGGQHAAAGVPSADGKQPETSVKGRNGHARGILGLEKRHVLLASAALVCSMGVSVLARALNA